MNRLFYSLAIFGWLTLPLQAQITELSHPDNLLVTHRLGCIEIEQISNVYTPADLAIAVSACAKKGKFETAIQLYFVYAVYGYFDSMRISDRSASAAGGPLNAEIFNSLDQSEMESMQVASQRMQQQAGRLFQDTCAATETLGPPSYVPVYMLAHGLKAFTFVEDQVEFLSRAELVRNLKPVDTEKLWREALYEVNQCPV